MLYSVRMRCVCVCVSAHCVNYHKVSDLITASNSNLWNGKIKNNVDQNTTILFQSKEITALDVFSSSGIIINLKETELFAGRLLGFLSLTKFQIKFDFCLNKSSKNKFHIKKKPDSFSENALLNCLSTISSILIFIL